VPTALLDLLKPIFRAFDCPHVAYGPWYGACYNQTMEKLIKRTYRVSKEHDKKVKKLAKKQLSESAVIRELITKAV
jgi:hypothetical protein